MTAEERAKERATCSVCLARTYRGNEDCVCENGGDAEDFDVVLAYEQAKGVAQASAHGVTVTIDKSETDGRPVVFVDTEPGDPEDERGPLIRVRLNDELLHGEDLPA